MEAARLSKKADGLLRAFDSLSEGIMVCDSSTPQLNILFLNDVWCHMTGTPVLFIYDPLVSSKFASCVMVTMLAYLNKRVSVH